MFRELTIGLINVIMGLDIFDILPSDYCEREKLGTAILITASALLVLGVLFAHKRHRANTLLIWLIASVVYIGLHVNRIGKCYDADCINLYIYGALLVCMEGVIYKAYTKELENPKDKNSNVVEEKPPTPTAPQESHPPSYETMVP